MTSDGEKLHGMLGTIRQIGVQIAARLRKAADFADMLVTMTEGPRVAHCDGLACKGGPCECGCTGCVEARAAEARQKA